MTARAPQGARLDPVLVALALLCALLSIALTGHQSGNNNNVYHLPLLVDLYDHPGFEHDAFVQSMRFYASGFWLLLRGVASRDNALDLFLPLQFASRSLFFAGVIAIAHPLGVTGRRATSLFLLFVAIAAPLRGESPAGGGGLFIRAFTHSELANATTLLSLALAMRGRFAWALLWAGATFFLNMFMAVWLSPVLAALTALAWRNEALSARRVLPQLAVGALACLPLVLPVLWSLSANPDVGQPTAFSYRQFLVEFWPYHMLIDWMPFDQLLDLASIMVAGLVAAWALPGGARARAAVAIGGYALVWIAGACVSLLTEAPLILNLHLLRSSALIVILAVVAVAALAAQLASRDVADPQGRADRRFWAPLLVLLIATAPSLTILVAPVLVIRARIPVPLLMTRPVTGIAATLLVAGMCASTAATAIGSDDRFREGRREWLAVADWTRASTPPGTTIFLPIRNMNAASSLPHDAQSEQHNVPGEEVFESFADRPLWVSYKGGAAVMWLPSYYPEWRQRMVEALRLSTLAERLRYAREHGIALVVERCAPGSSPLPAFRTAHLCAYRANVAATLPQDKRAAAAAA